jgi:molecular chaperone HscA
VDIFNSVLKDAELKHEDLEGIILVGGSVRLPIIREAIKEEFGVHVFEGVDPDRTVALGAGLYAFNLQHRVGNLLLDVCPLSLGIETLNGLALRVVHRNSGIPIEASTELTTGEDFQTGISIHVLQGEREFAKDLRSLARFELAGIPPLPKGMAQVIVTFKLDEDGILSVSALERTSGKAAKIQVRPSYNLQTKDIKKMFEDAMRYGKEDMQKRVLEEAKMEAKSILASAKNYMAEFGGEALSPLVAKLEVAMEEQSEDKIKKTIDEIRALIHPE